MIHNIAKLQIWGLVQKEREELHYSVVGLERLRTTILAENLLSLNKMRTQRWALRSEPLKRAAEPRADSPVSSGTSVALKQMSWEDGVNPGSRPLQNCRRMLSPAGSSLKHTHMCTHKHACTDAHTRGQRQQRSTRSSFSYCRTAMGGNRPQIMQGKFLGRLLNAVSEHIEDLDKTV